VLGAELFLAYQNIARDKDVEGNSISITITFSFSVKRLVPPGRFDSFFAIWPLHPAKYRHRLIIYQLHKDL